MDIARIDTLYRTILIKLDLYIVVQLRTHIVTTPIYVNHAFIGIVRWITISNYTFLKIKIICMSKRETLKRRVEIFQCPPHLVENFRTSFLKASLWDAVRDRLKSLKVAKSKDESRLYQAFCLVSYCIPYFHMITILIILPYLYIQLGHQVVK